MADRHQHQTPERTQAEARVREARKAFDDQWEVFVEAKQDFEGHAGRPRELTTFKHAWETFGACAYDLDHAMSALDALDRSIP